VNILFTSSNHFYLVSCLMKQNIIRVKAHSKLVDLTFPPLTHVLRVWLGYSPIGIINCSSMYGNEHSCHSPGNKYSYVYVSNKEMFKDAKAEFNENTEKGFRKVDVILTLCPRFLGYDIIKCEPDKNPCSYPYK